MTLPVGGVRLADMDHREIRFHRDILLLCAAVVAAACVLQVLPNGRVAIIGFADHPLPHSCLSRSLFGIDCPACGLTRSFIHLFHGDLRASWDTHRLGWLFAAVLVGQVPYRLAAMQYPRRDYFGRVWVNAAIYAVLTLLILNWVVNLFV